VSAEAGAIISTLGMGIVGALALYFRNLAKRSDPDFQQKLQKDFLVHLDEERAQRRAELADVTNRATEERSQRKEELRELKIDNRAELVAVKLEFKTERDGLIAKLAALELRFDTLKMESEARYKTDTEALSQRVEALEKVIVDLQREIADLKTENAGLRSDADKRPGGER
jgi:hypothetical protein